MARYYNRRRSPAPTFSPGDKVYLDSEDIQTTCPSKKLSHHRLGPYPVDRHVGKYAYRLILPPPMRRLHPVFNVVKLTLTSDNPIVGSRQNPPPPPELVNGEDEYVVEKVLNSRMFQGKLQYLVKWEGYGVEGNTWEYWENLGNAQEKVTEFYIGNPAAPHCIRALAFGSIPFRPISATPASSRCCSRGGVIVRGTPFHQTVSALPPTSRDIMPASALTPACISASAFRSPSPPALGSPLAPTAPDPLLFSTRFLLVPCWRAT